MQNYELEYLRDFIFQMRLNQGSFQPYISILEKRQKADWDAVLLSPPANYYSTRILTHYEDFCLGLRYLSGQESQESVESGLSLLRLPLLNAKQFVMDTRISYQKAALRRNSRFYFDPWFLYDSFYQRLGSRYTPEINLGYGLTDNLELTSGLAFSFPYKYRYSYQRYFLGNLFNGVRGRYLFKRSFDIPLQLRYRLKQNLEILFSSDFSYSQQELNYSDFNGVKTVYETKKLGYFNAQPSIALSYLADGGRAIKEDRFSRLTQAFLSSGQLLVEFRYLRDLTDLDKNAANGAQNKIIPYELFVNPLELFASGTEYAAAFTGNKSDTAANVAAQNYHLFQLAVRHGFFDRFNAGAGIGYRTSSHFHHFVLAPDASFGRLSRAYVLKPYWFFSVPCDWRFSENSLLSLVWYYVPQYRTEIGIEGVAKEFKSKTNYYSISLALKVLF
jgi:hypothetical protein